MATKVVGVDVLVKASGAVLGSQRDASLSVSAKEIDVSDKTSGGWDTFLVGNRSWEISCDCIALADDTGQNDLIDDTLEGKIVEIVFAHGPSKVFTGSAVITGVNMTGPKDDVSTASFTLKGASPLAVEKAPVFSSVALTGANKIATITFSGDVVSNVVGDPALKAAVTFSALGTTFVALAAGDTVAIATGKLVVTFASAITGGANKIKIGAYSLKSANGATQVTEQTTTAIAAV